MFEKILECGERKLGTEVLVCVPSDDVIIGVPQGCILRPMFLFSFSLSLSILQGLMSFFER